MKNEIIYLDNNATTPTDPRVVEAMLPYFTELYANPASNHLFGTQVNQAVKDSREKISQLLGCNANEIIFTSGATEAINLAIKGVAEQNTERARHIVTVSTEHPAVLETCRYMETIGFEVTYLPVDCNGLLDLGQVKNAIRDDTLLVCVMLVNNETGVIQPIIEISALAHEKGAFFMSDATQAVGKIPIDINAMGIDLLAFSGHKFYGPKGIGGLYVRSRRPNKVRLSPIIHGGGHELGVRSGTLNVPGIVGLGTASEIAMLEMNKNKEQIGRLRNELERSLLALPNTSLNGHPEKRLYNVSNICFHGIDADALMIGMEGIVVSNGSACSSTKVEPSHVLTAMGKTPQDAYSSIRFSLGSNVKNYLNIADQLQVQIHSIRNLCI